MDRDKLMKMAGAVRTGGKGTMRRKKKAVHKNTSTDDKRLQNTLKRLGVNTIPGIEEVNIFKDDCVVHFTNPKAFAELSDLLPNIINQLGPDSMVNLKKLAQQYQAGGGAAAGGAAMIDDDDDVPELVENFDEVAAK